MAAFWPAGFPALVLCAAALLPSTAAASVALIGAIVSGWYFYSAVWSRAQALDSRFGTVMLLPPILGGAAVYLGSLYLTGGPHELPPSLPSESYFFVGILLLFIGSFLLGLLPAVTVKDPLPQVQISKQSESTLEGVSKPLEGRLVAHRDGFWHLFLDNEDGVLLSIPDGQVLSVRTGLLRFKDPRPEEDTKPGLDKGVGLS